MDFFHLSIGHVSRSQGRSVVQNVAYITGKVLIETRRELRANYANNRGAFWETMAPEGSGIGSNDLSFWDKLESFEDDYARVRFKNPASLQRYLTSARVGQTYEFSLPKEFTRQQQIDLIREVAASRFVSLGLLATYAIHEEEGNPHVHITVSTRTVWGGEISWDKSVARQLTSQIQFRESRRLFAEVINKHQELAGLPDRVDHRSYAERGIELLSTHHKGSHAHQLEKDGIYSRIVEENRKIFEENKERITREPGIILAELTSKQATFSERDVVKLVHKRLGGDMGVLVNHVIHSVLKQAVEVGIGFDDLKRYTSPEYKAKEDHILQSFEAYQEQKASIPLDAERVAGLLGGDASWLNEGQQAAVKILCDDRKAALMVGRAGTGKTTALRYIVTLHKQAGYGVIGMAPSATAANELAKGAGCGSDTIAHHAHYWRLYHNAVEGQGAATTDKDRKHFGKLVKKYEKYLPTRNTLILVDEAGMVGVGGSNDRIAGGWGAIIKTVNVTGCKLILVGDDCQFKPVDAGDIFRKFVEVAREKGTLCTLDQIQRQTVPWMREASAHLSELKSGVALEMYEREGHVQQYDTDEQVYQEMARQYLRNMIREPDSDNIVLAYTNAEIRELNGAIRKVLKENGLLAAEDVLQRPHWTSPSLDAAPEGTQSESQAIEVGADSEDVSLTEGRGARESSPTGIEFSSPLESFAPFGSVETAEDKHQAEKWKDGYTVGDRIIFTQNDRGFWTKFQSPDSSFFVRNGTQGIIQAIKPCRIRDRETGEIHQTHKIVAIVGGADANTKDKTTVSFYLKEYTHFQHGYTITSHKSQGATADGALIKASPYMDAHAFYVALTRHRSDVGIYYSKSDFANFNDLVKAAGRITVKDLAVDYTVSEDRSTFWTNVQDYKALGYELHSIRAFGKGADKTNKPEWTRIWENYEKVKAERKGLAKLILADCENHKDFVRQAGLTFETLEIAAGLRKRPLSRLEVEAQEVVESYVSVAIETRETWRTIRKSHPGTRAKAHPDWNTFEALREQRGELANQIIQNPELYRPLLREAALAWEDGTDKVGKNHFGYGIAIIRAQAEAHQSKMLQQEILKSASDPILGERLQILISYVETRDLTAAAWQDLRPRLKEFEGTLLSEGFCKEITEFTDMRMERDQQAARIVDYWEDYRGLIQKAGLKLDAAPRGFDKLFEQKEQSVRDVLFKAYTTAQDGTVPSEMAKLKAAAELKALMDDEFASGKKITAAQVHQQGLQPKDIARDALHYQEREMCQTEEDHKYVKVIYGYHQSVAAANDIYRTCLREGEKLNLPLPDTTHYQDYITAVAHRNEMATMLLGRDDWQECWDRAYFWNLDLNEDTLTTQMQDGQRGKLLDQYRATNSTLVKLLIAREVKDMLIEDKKAGRKATVADLYGRKILSQTIQGEARQFDRMTAYATLTTDAEKQIFSALESYDDNLTESKKHYATACREAKDQGIQKESTPAYADFQRALKECQEMASLAANAGRPAVRETIAEDMEIALDTLYKDARIHELKMGQLKIDQQAQRTTELALEKPSDLASSRALNSNNLLKIASEAELMISQTAPSVVPQASTVIEDKHDLSKVPDRTREIIQIAEGFIKLSERYQTAPAAEVIKMMEKLNSIEGEYATDKTFAATIQNSGSRAAINRLEVELYMQELGQSRDRGRGMEPEGASPNDGGNSQGGAGSPENAAGSFEGAAQDSYDCFAEPEHVSKITQIAKEFIELSERYQKPKSVSEMNGMMIKLNSIEGKYATNKTFADTIKNSGSRAANNRLEVQLYMQEINQSRDRGRDM